MPKNKKHKKSNRVHSAVAPTLRVTEGNTTDVETTQLDGIRQDVFLDRYSLKDEQGRATESTPELMWRRTARGIAAVEKTDAKEKNGKKNFTQL